MTDIRRSPIEVLEIRLVEVTEVVEEVVEERCLNFLGNSSVLYKLSTAAIATYTICACSKMFT